MPNRIPVTVIGGYLGSGKTSLVNHVLRSTEERLAIVVNDFGEINIDVDLIAAQQDALPDGVVALANGCICCTLVDGFAATLDSLAGMADRPDRILIEASGVSDPATIAAYCHGPGLELDAVVVMADAETIRDRVDDVYVGQTIAQQLAAADVVVVNKSDLIDADGLDDVVAWVTHRCADALVTHTSGGAVPTEILFGIEPARRQKPAVGSSASPSDHEPERHGHAAFHSWVVEHDRPWTRDLVDALMASLPESVIRAKGFVHLDANPDHRMVLQRVGRRWTMRRGQAWGQQPRTQLVFIATDAGAEQTVATLVDELVASALGEASGAAAAVDHDVDTVHET